MKEATGHIISSFSWNTRFSKKDRAVELQERLSAYSKFNLHQEIAAVFDKVCPPDQTWKIPLLEIDLGVTGFNNLESELAFKLRKQLYEKIINIIFYANKNSGSNIEIFTREASQLEILAAFLQSGLLPWNYQPAFGSVKQIMQYQLENNRQMLIEMIREIGGSHENVRKRIAWQICEPQIVKIIEGLEPDNYREVIDFSNELYLLQARRNLVQTSTTDFKKNLLCWALNFLLNERGTLFNKVAFMKSSIRQMADHYNIRYEELFRLIELAVEEAGKKIIMKTDFVLTIKALSKENRDKKNKVQQAKDLVDHWARLKQLFNSKCLELPAFQRSEMNELVTSLRKENKARFRSFIAELVYDEKDWTALAKNLNNVSLEAIFCAVNPGLADRLTACIYFLDKIGSNLNPRIEIKTLWTAGLKFLHAGKTQFDDNQAFLACCIAHISKTSQVGYQKLLGQFLSAGLPSSAKTDSAFSIYNDLSKVCFAGMEDENPAFLHRQINDLIMQLASQIKAGIIETQSFAEAKRYFLKIVRVKPSIALKALMEYRDKSLLKKLMVYLFNPDLVRLLVSSAENKKKESLFLLADIAAQLNKKHELALPEEWINEKLIHLGLECLLINPAFNLSKFLSLTIYNWLQLAPAQAWEPGNLFMEKLTAQEHFQPLAISGALVEKLKRKYSHKEQPFAYRWIMQFVRQRPGKQVVVSKMLSDNFHDAAFESSRNNKNKDTEELINYLAPGFAHSMNDSIDDYTNVITRCIKNSSTTTIKQQVTEIGWKCLLNFTDHHGNGHTLQQCFRSAVIFRFPIREKSFSKQARDKYLKGRTNEPAALNGEIKMAPRQIFLLIKKCFDLGTESIEYDGQTLDLSGLINRGLEIKPAEFRKILSASPVSQQSVELLRDNVSFNNFSAWIMHDTCGRMKDSIEMAGALYDFVSHLVSGPVAVAMLNEYWKQTWNLFKTNKALSQHLKRMADFSFQLIAGESGINAEFVQSQIRTGDLAVSTRLSSIVARYIPGISATLDEVPVNTNEKKEAGEKLQMVAQKGLLNDLAYSLVVQKKIPYWLDHGTTIDNISLLNELLVQYPVNFLVAIKKQVMPEAQIHWLGRSLNFKKLITSIGNLHGSKRSLMNILEKFYDALGKVTASGISATDLQAILLKKVLKAWTSNNWRIISTEMIWNELMWDVCFKAGVSRNVFLRDLKKVQDIFPPSLQVGLKFLTATQKSESSGQVKVINVKAKEKVAAWLTAPGKKRDVIFVRNAGLVLLNSYFQILFERLDLMDAGKKFRDKQSQAEATHYLQYLVTGLSRTDESLLPLNKVVCGLPLMEPVPESISISEENKKLMDGLIKAAIGYWPVIGGCSITGFRGNWLVRDGLLIEQEDRWELNVEKRAYDILIHKSPFSFSIIKHQWMDKPIHVLWPY